MLFDQGVVLMALLLLSGFFSAAETALFSISKAKAVYLAKQNGSTCKLIKNQKTTRTGSFQSL
jgi:magnesium and cobalt exporter, CNNM family